MTLQPIPLPGAIEMIGRASQSDPLPVFDSVENRIALGLGGTLLLCAVVFMIGFELRRAIRPADR